MSFKLNTENMRPYIILDLPPPIAQ